MAVQNTEVYGDVLKVILKPTKNFPEGYFYTDNNLVALSLVNSYTWSLRTQGNNTYVLATTYDKKTILFHREYAYSLLNYYPDYIDHINGLEIDNRNINLNEVTQQQNTRNKPSIGYQFVAIVNSFLPQYVLDGKIFFKGNFKTEPEALLATYELRQQYYTDYNYNFLKDRRYDIDLLDLELTNKITIDYATYLHIKRYVEANPWYVYRYNLFDYCKQNNIIIPKFKLDSQGFMINPVTKQRLCPY